jgi:hypothetical protein
LGTRTIELDGINACAREDADESVAHLFDFLIFSSAPHIDETGAPDRSNTYTDLVKPNGE